MQTLGITYGPELELPKEKKETCHGRGLSFVCYQSSVVNGFEFMYVTFYILYCRRHFL